MTPWHIHQKFLVKLIIRLKSSAIFNLSYALLNGQIQRNI